MFKEDFFEILQKDLIFGLLRWVIDADKLFWLVFFLELCDVLKFSFAARLRFLFL